MDLLKGGEGIKGICCYYDNSSTILLIYSLVTLLGFLICLWLVKLGPRAISSVGVKGNAH